MVLREKRMYRYQSNMHVIRGGKNSLEQPVRNSYLRYRNQIEAGVRCAKAQYQRQSDSRTEQTNFDLMFEIMRQVLCQNVEIEVQRDHCQVPGFSSVSTAQLKVGCVCLQAHCEGDSQGDLMWAIFHISERWRSVTVSRGCSHSPRRSDAPCCLPP